MVRATSSRSAVERRREIGVGAHAAGVGAAIVVKDRLVILGGFERQDALAVAQADEADLLAGEELLDHYLAAGGSDEVAGKHIMKCRKSGGAIRQMTTPLPAASPSAFNTMGYENESSALFASSSLSATTYRAVGMRYRSMNSLAKILLPSRRAAA